MSKWSSNICKSLFATTEFQHFRFPLSGAHKSHTMHLNTCSAREFLRSRANVKKKKKKGGVSYERICSVFGLQQADRTPSEVEYFHSSLTISTLLHVAIMRDKALSNEQLHVVRAVPRTNHCVWRKTFLCTNIPAHSSPALPPHEEGRKMQAVGWTPLLKGRAAVTHIHVWDSGGIQTACLAHGFL